MKGNEVNIHLSIKGLDGPYFFLYNKIKEKCMFLEIFATTLAIYFLSEAYKENQIGWAIFWGILLGWDIHSLLFTLLTRTQI